MRVIKTWIHTIKIKCVLFCTQWVMQGVGEQKKKNFMSALLWNIKEWKLAKGKVRNILGAKGNKFFLFGWKFQVCISEMRSDYIWATHLSLWLYQDFTWYTYVLFCNFRNILGASQTQKSNNSIFSASQNFFLYGI